MTGCRFCMSKTVVVIVNFVLGLLGLVLIAAGGKLMAGVCNTTPHQMKTLTENTVIGVMVAGGSLFLISLIGCCAVSKRTRRYAIVYLIGCILVFLAQGGVTYFVFNESQVVSQFEKEGVDVNVDKLKKDLKKVEENLAADVATMFKNGKCQGTATDITIGGDITFKTAVECQQCPLLEAAFKIGCTQATDVQKDAQAIADCTASILKDESVADTEAVVAFCACKASVAREVHSHMAIANIVCISILGLETILFLSVCYLACTKREEMRNVIDRRPMRNEAQMERYPMA